MKKQLVTIVLGALILCAAFASCSKDKEEENENEVITTMKLTFVPVGGGTTLTYQFDDADGPGGAAPTQDEIILAPSKSYTVTVQLLNKTVTPAEDVTLEVQGESEAHRFYYDTPGASNIAVSGFDNDTDGVPLGITSTWTTGAVATSTMHVVLRHYPGTPPNKAAADPIDSPKSSTDTEVTFVTKIQ